MTSSKPTRPPRAGPLGAGTVVPRPRAERPTPAGTGLVPRQQRVPAGPELPLAAAEGAAARGLQTPGVRGPRTTDSRAPGSQPRICGLDLSLTSTGFARVCGTDVLIERLQPGKRKGHERLEYLRTAIGDRCHDADLVVIEGPSYGSTGGREHERGGLWWLIAHTLWREAVPYAVCPPAVLKRYACGRGNADKDQVLASVIRRYPDVMVSGNDTADALVLAAMGARHLGWQIEVSPPHRVVLPANHLDAMAKVEWPGLAGPGRAP